MKSKNNHKSFKSHLFNCIDYLPILISGGKGSFVTDELGNKYLDLDSGQFCSIFGHTCNELNTLLVNQLNKNVHTSTRAISPEVLQAVNDFDDICHDIDTKTFFLSTGSEAVECAIRYAKHIKGKPGLVCFDNGYHGLSLGSQSITFGGAWAYPKISDVFSIVPPIFHELSNLQSEIQIKQSLLILEQLFSENQNIAAFIMEPIISVGGMNILTKDYCEKIAKLCIKHDILLIYDECQTGMGRTGKWFCYEHYDVKPDIIISAKALGAGLPVSAVTFNKRILNNINLSISHYSSHQNDPLSAAVVSFVIHKIQNEKLLLSVKNTGNYFISKLNEFSKTTQFITKPRGKGLMIGFDIFVENTPSYRKISEEFTTGLLKEGILIQATSQGKTYRILPNYYISNSEIDMFFSKLEKVISTIGY